MKLFSFVAILALMTTPALLAQDIVDKTPPDAEKLPPKFSPDVPDKTPAETNKAAQAGLDMIDGALKTIDKDVSRDGNIWRLKVGDSFVAVIADPVAERMRIMMPIAPASSVDEEKLRRLMQANFDSALDARYAVANDLVWGVFIHKLSTLGKDDFLSGLAQTITVVGNYGSSYSSGALVFGGGDSQDINANDVLEKLQESNEEDARNTV
jgi:hypothetical protein